MNVRAIDLPETLMEMYRAASSYKVISNTGKVVSATVFTSRVESLPPTERLESQQNPTIHQQATQATQSTQKVPRQPRPPKPTKTRGSKPPNPCKHCGGDHWNNECPTLESSTGEAHEDNHVQGRVNLSFSRAIIDVCGVVLKTSPECVNESPLVLNCIGLDTMANVSTFANGDLLRDITVARTALSAEGINKDGEPLKCVHEGLLEPLGMTVWYSPNSSANILGFDDVTKLCDVVYDQLANTFTVSHRVSGFTMTFKAANDGSSERGLYYMVAL